MRRTTAVPGTRPHPVEKPTGTWTLRLATEQDVPAITEIFNQGIEDRMATFEENPHTVEERLRWFLGHGPREPIVVAETEGAVTGWASLSQYSPRACYDRVEELSIYVRRQWRARGVGGALMDRLLEEGAKQGVHKVVLHVFPFNTNAIALYRKKGFRKVGTFRHHGVRWGEWLDLIAMERDLVGD